MTTLSNKTRKPLSVPLPRGKTLHLGPGKTGQIAPSAVEHPPLKKLIDAGEIEILDENQHRAEGAVGPKGRPGSAHGHSSGGVNRRSGDR